jgi:hypothetical protein
MRPQWRDHSGHVRAFMCTIEPYVLDSTVAEALAARQGVKFCRDLGIQSILLEGDTRKIVFALEARGDCLGRYGSIIVWERCRVQACENGRLSALAPGLT